MGSFHLFRHPFNRLLCGFSDPLAVLDELIRPVFRIFLFVYGHWEPLTKRDGTHSSGRIMQTQAFIIAI